MKTRLLAPISAGFVLAAMAQAQTTTIDTFETKQFVIADLTPGVTNSCCVVAPGAIGGERDLCVRHVGGAVATLVGDVGYVFTNTASLSCGLSVEACLHLVYDGLDNSRDINCTGLNGLDITEGGTRNAFRLSTTSDLGANVAITVYQDATHYSVAMVTVAADPTFTFSEVTFGFADFMPAGPEGGADFTRVGALVFELCNGPGGADISMKNLVTTYDSRFGDGSPGFWKNHPDAWPVDALTLGAVTYSKEELLALMAQPANGDASIALAYQLIAAKLNVARGRNPIPAIQDAIATADSLLASFPGSLPFAVGKKDPRRAAMVAIASQLAAFNTPPY